MCDSGRGGGAPPSPLIHLSSMLRRAFSGGYSRLGGGRRLGELLRDMPKNAGAANGKTRSHDDTASPKLADIGINKSESSRCQAIAEVLKAEFEGAIAGAREEDREVTSREMVVSLGPPAPHGSPPRLAAGLGLALRGRPEDVPGVQLDGVDDNPGLGEPPLVGGD